MYLRRTLLFVLSAFYLYSCASTPRAPGPAAPTEPPTAPPVLSLPETPDAFAALEDWLSASVAPGVEAFLRSCDAMVARSETELVSASAPWAGTVGEWLPVCESLRLVDGEAAARRVLEALTLPVELESPDGASRFTGYFEPTIAARYAPAPGFTAPVPGPPSDLEQGTNGPLQRLPDGTTRPYPPRAEIIVDPSQALGFAHPADVFFLQIQGSGRLIFEDGRTLRAAYFAHNGQPFRSTANWLIDQGEITPGEASMQGIRAWMDRAPPARVAEAMNANPRFVFFQPLPEGDTKLGPQGAAGIPLTPFGSMAIDRDYHPLGIPYLVQTEAPGLGGRWQGILVSQDTGGAIKGAVRGDIYFGTGNEAGQRAGTMNAHGRMWALLPRSVATRLTGTQTAGIEFATGTLAP